MNKYLIKLADHLDKKGLHKEADYVDWIVKNAFLEEEIDMESIEMKDPSYPGEESPFKREIRRYKRGERPDKPTRREYPYDPYKKKKLYNLITEIESLNPEDMEEFLKYIDQITTLA
tara:strand:- start:162 stop:512 length:351 start_codon:yes stop_codon:yes gene_type:complete